MRSALSIMSVIVLTLALSSTAAYAQKTSAGYDQSVDFSNYKTFMIPDQNGARNPFVNKLIMEALVRELTARGLTKVDTDGDLRISYLAANGPNLRVDDVHFGYTVNPSYIGIMPIAATTMWDVTTGTLLIDLFDNKTDKVVFRGTASEVLQRAPSSNPMADAKLVTKPINKSIAKIFKKYPVKGK